MKRRKHSRSRSRSPDHSRKNSYHSSSRRDYHHSSSHHSSRRDHHKDRYSGRHDEKVKDNVSSSPKPSVSSSKLCAPPKPSLPTITSFRLPTKLKPSIFGRISAPTNNINVVASHPPLIGDDTNIQPSSYLYDSTQESKTDNKLHVEESIHLDHGSSSKNIDYDDVISSDFIDKEDFHTQYYNFIKDGYRILESKGKDTSRYEQYFHQLERLMKGSKRESDIETSPDTQTEIDPLDAYMASLEGAHKQDWPGSGKETGGRELIEHEETYEFLRVKDDNPSWLNKNQPKAKKMIKVDHTSMKYHSFKKSFYIEHPDIARLSDKEVEMIRKIQLEGVQIRGKDCPKPILNWEHCGLHDKILKTLEKLSYTRPFPIQAQVIPALMSGRDIIACAKTGSGKTCAYLLPMFRHIMDQPPLSKDDGPIALVLSPTRELAIQIHIEVKRFAKPLGLRSACVYGGAAIADQIADLKRGAEIVVATPGRLIDMLCANNGKITNLSRTTYLVIDEADRMFDLGFEPQIMAVVDCIRPGRQTSMFSATFPRMIEMLAKKALNSPLEIIIGGRSVAPGNITQIVEVINGDEKLKRLLEILNEHFEKGLILIFCDRQETVDDVFRELALSGYQTLTLHGGMNQIDRDFAITDFRNKLRTIMIATSIAARGLDIKDLNLVVNYSVPNHYEDYIHRIGRTGRAGQDGTAITFITTDDGKFAPDLVQALTKSNQVVPKKLRDLAEINPKKDNRLAGYAGSGFKFNEEEDLEVKEFKKLQGLDYGIEEDMPELEDASSDEDETKPSNAIAAQVEAAKAAAANAKAFLAAGNREAAEKVVNKIKNPGSSSRKKGTGIGVALEKAKELTIKSIGGGLIEEVEINDWPQYSRWKVTHKGSLDNIMEWFDVFIQIKGIFIPQGRKPQLGERKLYVSIEGRNELKVQNAKSEIMRILEEAAANAKPETGLYAKYNPLLITHV